MSAFTFVTFAGFLLLYTGIALGLYFGLRFAKII
ncbi:MAG: cytochrome b6-f complex subunit PetL [Prochloraceae cyanobacterium]|nr:cytochrome b6-f complex subunit PetL [Prochloraceae cyanobacterium]